MASKLIYIAAGLEPVLSHTEKPYIASYSNFTRILKKNHKIDTKFHFDIRGKLSIIRYDK